MCSRFLVFDPVEDEASGASFSRVVSDSESATRYFPRAAILPDEAVMCLSSHSLHLYSRGTILAIASSRAGACE